MIFASFKSFAAVALASQAMFTAPAHAQVDAVTNIVCGAAGAANFLSPTELLAAVTCLTTLTGCNSTDLPAVARTDLLDLGILGDLLDNGVLDSVLKGGLINGGLLDTSVLTGLLDGGVLDDLLNGGLLGGDLLGGLLGNVGDVVDEVLNLVEELLANLLGYYGDDISGWCVGLLSNFDNLFSGLTVSVLCERGCVEELIS